MRKTLVLGLLAALTWARYEAVQAQVNPDLREQLLTSEVVVSDSLVYAMASGTQRGTLEGSQEWLVTRAMRSMAHKLCGFVPTPGRRLEAGLQGVTLMSAEVRGSEMVVLIRAPVQKPACKVTLLEPVQTPAAPPRLAETPPRTVGPGEPRSSDIVIRKYGSEY